MKVNIAAQTLSASVADAIDYCTDVLKLRQFKGSAAMVKFIRVFDDLFDILNSQSIRQRLQIGSSGGEQADLGSLFD